MTNPAYINGKPVITGRLGSRTVWPDVSQPAQDAMPVGTREPAAESGLLFDADFPKYGLSRYEANNIAGGLAVLDSDWGICADPDGSGAIVGWCDNWGGKTNTNTYARSQALTRRIIKPAYATDPFGTYAIYTRLWIDPVSSPMSSEDWINIQGLHGPPFIGPSPLGFLVVQGPGASGMKIRMGDVESRLGNGMQPPSGEWFQIFYKFRYAYATDGGYCDLYFCPEGDINSPNWVRLPVEGGFKVPLDVINDEEGSAYLTDKTRGPSYSSWGCYGNKRAITYCSHHRIATTAADAMPTEWSGSLAGVNPDII